MSVQQPTELASNQPVLLSDIAYRTGAAHKLDLHIPSAARLNALPLVVFIHGGAWRA